MSKPKIKVELWKSGKRETGADLWTGRLILFLGIGLVISLGVHYWLRGI